MIASDCDDRRSLLAVEMDGGLDQTKSGVDASGRRIDVMRFLRAVLKQSIIAVGAVAIASLFLVFYGISPIDAYKELFLGAFGSTNAVAETLNYMTPILLAALAVILCFRCGIWNIGVEGQLYLGGIATAGLGLHASGLPTAVALVGLAIGAFLAGAAWAAVPAILKARFDANEIIITIMMNFLAIILATYLITGPWGTGITPVTRSIAPNTYLPLLIGGTRLHANLVVALVSAFLLSVIIRQTVFGYQLRAVGMNPRAARVFGISVNRVSMVSFIMAGGIAGLAGYGEVAGVHHALPDGLSPGFGYTGIAVALLGGLNPVWSILSAFFIAALNVGGASMQRALGVPVFFVAATEGLLLLSFLASGALRRRGP
jgi:simple sugar transport system permease protein